jgi:hypothetical protein
MKIRITAIAFLAFVAGGMTPPAARAAGVANYTTSGVPYKWDNSKSIIYNIDQGPLGKLSNTQAADLVTKAFQQWSSVDTAKLTFEEGDPLDRDVTGANLSDFLNGLPSDVNPVIFDNDGGVTDAMLGGGASLDVPAFGLPDGNRVTPTGLIAGGFLVINARALDGLFDPDDLSMDDLTRIVEQGVGSMLDLAPSDLNDEVIFAGNVPDNAAVPIMHPGSAINGYTIPVLGGGTALTVDDRMSVSALYPSGTFSSSTGTIQGQVLLPDGTTGLQGIDVIARKTDDPMKTAVSAISGESFESGGLGSRDPSLRGAFTIHVPPGSYTLEFRPLRRGIGPLQGIFPLPGGDQFYQASAAPAPAAGPAVPASATPVTVTGGQSTTVNLVASGKPAPAPQVITAPTTPHNSTATAPLLPLSATVTGHVAPSPPGTQAQIVRDTGGGTRDVVEDLYRLDVPEQSILTLLLVPKDKVDLDLYVFAGFPGGAASPLAAASLTDGTDPEAIQAVLGPGTYFIGVSAWDNVQHPAATDYTLSVTTTPLPVQPTPQRPVLNQLVLGNITDKSADVSWISDTDSSTAAVVGIPLQQFGDPTLGKTHHATLTGLTPAAVADLTALSQNAAGQREFFPKVYFNTAASTAATGPTKVQAVIGGELEDFIYNGDTDLATLMLEVTIQNSGAPATNVQITSLTPSPGWKLAVPLAQPLVVGGIGSNGVAIVGIRLLRGGTGPAPLATVTGSGTLTAADGTTANFTVGP